MPPAQKLFSFVNATNCANAILQTQKELVLGVAKERLYNVVIPQVHASATAQVLSRTPLLNTYRMKPDVRFKVKEVEDSINSVLREQV